MSETDDTGQTHRHSDPPEPGTAEPPPSTPSQESDPLRQSRTSRAWLATAALAALLVLLIVFIAQNTDRAAIHFLGWTWHTPLAVAMLVGVGLGMLLAVVAGSLRIWQLRRRVRRTG